MVSNAVKSLGSQSSWSSSLSCGRDIWDIFLIQMNNFYRGLMKSSSSESGVSSSNLTGWDICRERRQAENLQFQVCKAHHIRPSTVFIVVLEFFFMKEHKMCFHLAEFLPVAIWLSERTVASNSHQNNLWLNLNVRIAAMAKKTRIIFKKKKKKSEWNLLVRLYSGHEHRYEVTKGWCISNMCFSYKSL